MSAEAVSRLSRFETFHFCTSELADGMTPSSSAASIRFEDPIKKQPTRKAMTVLVTTEPELPATEEPCSWVGLGVASLEISIALFHAMTSGKN